jgi:NADH-quinone oxidoreductase E subunit
MIPDEVKAQMREIAARYPQPRSAMLPCLHLAQQTEGYITSEGAQAVAEAVGARVDEVESVVSFYSMYTTKPLGAQVIKVCTSVSCYLRGADALLARLEERLGVKKGQTTPDGRFTVDMIECLAACGMAPVLQVNGEFVENVTPERADALMDRLERGEGVGDLGSRWRLTEQGGFTTAGSTTSASGGSDGPAKETS